MANQAGPLATIPCCTLIFNNDHISERSESMRPEGCVTKTAPINKRVVMRNDSSEALVRLSRNTVCGTSCASASQSASLLTVYLCTSRGAVNGFSFNLFQHYSLNSADVDIWPRFARSARDWCGGTFDGQSCGRFTKLATLHQCPRVHWCKCLRPSSLACLQLPLHMWLPS